VKRITILLATVAAFLIVPVANASAHTFKIEFAGTGEGLVEGFAETATGFPTFSCSGPPAAGECEEEYPSRFFGIFEAYPEAGSEFAGWSNVGGNLAGSNCGEIDPSYGECEFGKSTEPFESMTLIATFCTEGSGGECEEGPPPSGPPLTLNIEEGEGTVVSNPAGIECTGAAPTSCETEEIAEGEEVTLTASPAAGYLFKGWKKCDKGGVVGRQCTVTLSEAKEVGAKFVASFDVTLQNGGGGKVYSKPGGALCLPNCSETTASFKEGKPVEVLTKPNKHFHLVEFGGDCSGTTCEGLEANSTVSATFAEDATHTLSLAKEGGGQGFVKAKPAGLNCTYTCSGQEVAYYDGEVLAIEVKLGKGTAGVEWTTPAGTCTGTALTCTVTMSSAKSLVAKFE
jgi:Divergent InlB B-repeat domain